MWGCLRTPWWRRGLPRRGTARQLPATVDPPGPDDEETLKSGTQHHEQQSEIRERPDRPFHPSNQRPRRVRHDKNKQQGTPTHSGPWHLFGVLAGRASSSYPPSRWCFRSVSHGLPPVSVCAPSRVDGVHTVARVFPAWHGPWRWSSSGRFRICSEIMRSAQACNLHVNRITAM